MKYLLQKLILYLKFCSLILIRKTMNKLNSMSKLQAKFHPFRKTFDFFRDKV